ncbi:hypothetical protein T492DRAFT_839013 [Pavlovales sp. CCMP2436]|nr:hypothetical protein T492DRAFT_839013 [Pavlovales sp. CCMP2436]
MSLDLESMQPAIDGLKEQRRTVDRDRVEVDKRNYVFIDRSGTHFGAILDYLRTGELDEPADAKGRHALTREFDFYMFALTPGKPMQHRSGYTREDVKAYLLADKSLACMDLSGLDLSGLRFAGHLWQGNGFNGGFGEPQAGYLRVIQESVVQIDRWEMAERVLEAH